MFRRFDDVCTYRQTTLVVKLLSQLKTRWTFFRVKLVFECEFEISWSFGPWDLGTPGPWNPWTLRLLDLFPPPTPPHTSPYILIPPPISASYSPPLVWFGYGGGVVTLEIVIGDGPLTFILMIKKLRGGWWVFLRL